MVARRPDFVSSAVFAPTGTARPDGKDLVIDGRWAFNSGCAHSDWFLNGVIVTDGDAPRMVPPGRPDWRFAFFPASQGQIVDTWHAAGLRGTGEHDVAAVAVRVPPERTIMPFFEPAQFEAPLYRLPFPSLLATFISGFPLASLVARLTSSPPWQTTSLVPCPPVQQGPRTPPSRWRWREQKLRVRSAKAFVVEALGAAWATVCAGDEMTVSQRATTVMATLNAASAARASVDSVFAMAGAGARFDSSPLQLCARDLMAGTQHIILSMKG